MNKNNKYNDEVISRWGNSKEYLEYQEKSKNYSLEKYASISNEMSCIFDEFYNCLCNNIAVNSNEVVNIVKKLQNFINSNFYDCTNEILLSLGKMYVCDERFKNNIDCNRNGTAEYVKSAIEYYCTK